MQEYVIKWLTGCAIYFIFKLWLLLQHGGWPMPKVGGKHFPYTKEGKKAAASYAKKTKSSSGGRSTGSSKSKATKKKGY